MFITNCSVGEYVKMNEILLLFFFNIILSNIKSDE